MMRILAAVARGEYTIDEVDTITGTGPGTPEERHFPHARSCRPRHPRPRGQQPPRTAWRHSGTRRLDAARLLRSNARARTHRGEGRPGILQTREAAERRLGHPHARPRHPRVRREAAGQDCIARGSRRRSETSATGCARCSRPTTRLAASSETHSRRRSCTRQGSLLRSRTRLTTSIACCDGVSAGSWVPSSSSTPSAYARWSKPYANPAQRSWQTGFHRCSTNHCRVVAT